MNSVTFPPFVPFSTMNNISMSIEKSNIALRIFKGACHTDPGAVRK